MKYKNILVHLDNSSGCRNRLEVAFGLARENKAHLLGLFVVPTYIVPSYVEAQISVDLINDVTEKALARARDTAARYEQLAKDAGVKLETAVLEDQLIPVLREHSKYADLLLLGQDHPEDPDNVSYGLADALLFEGGCACLIVPHSGKVTTPGKRVLLTWNASRESARALRDAIPLLSGADSVVVLSSEPDGGDNQLANGHPHAEALLRLLKSHGIAAVSSGFNNLDVNASDAIVGQAVEMKADLIVMGAYGHARLREIILGGVTRDLLKQAPTCLLLSH
jgi:nucleotide-binding universal stress UspA family protein